VRNRQRSEASLRNVRQRFANFLSLLDANNRVLKLLGDLEEKAQGEQLYDLSYIRSTVAEIRDGVQEIIEVMISLGGSDYEPLRQRFARIDAELEAALSGTRPVVPGAYTIRFGELGREEVSSVGGKNAQLGELRSKLGLLVPDGFAISAWAYKQFIGANNLQERITDALAAVDIRRYEELVRVSETIQAEVVASAVPEDLQAAILKSVAEVVQRSGTTRFALRSSALSEDDLLTFAGQYRSILNVRGAEVIERYREILAGKFTPKAIFYLLSHAFRESDLAMCVGCISMVDAVSSGVVYTRDPVHPEDGCIARRVSRAQGRMRIGRAPHRPQAGAPRDAAGDGYYAAAGARRAPERSFSHRGTPVRAVAHGAGGRATLRHTSGPGVGPGSFRAPVPASDEAAAVAGSADGPPGARCDGTPGHARRWNDGLPRSRLRPGAPCRFERRSPHSTRQVCSDGAPSVSRTGFGAGEDQRPGHRGGRSGQPHRHPGS
jgi:hypothetical protein